MKKKLRIAFGRIAQETNALSPVPTTLEDFQATLLVEGDALLTSVLPGGVEAPGFAKKAELAGFVKAMHAADGAEVELVPLLNAWAVPGGPLSRACFDTLVGRFTELLRAAGPVDAVMVSLHGAMGVEGLRDPDTAILRAVHDAAPGVPIAATEDLHANNTQARIEAAEVLVGYKTNPHRDHAATGRRAGELLLATLLGRVRPVTSWRSLPMILGGGSTIDVWPPMLSIFWRMRMMERDPRVLNASIYPCHPWNDDPALGWSTVVTTDGELHLADELADELAERCWAVRNEQPPAFPSVEEAIDAARAAKLARTLGVVCLSDASDVVTAGATGDNTRLLAALLERGEGMLSYAGIRDPVVARALFGTPAGEGVAVSVGGRLDPGRNLPLEVRGRVLSTHDRPGYGKTVVLDLGPVRLVVTEGPALIIKPSYYEDVGLSIWRADVVVVKNFFPFRLFFLPMARKTIYVRTKGITDLDAAYALTFDGPVHPRDPVGDWRATDQRRRHRG